MNHRRLIDGVDVCCEKLERIHLELNVWPTTTATATAICAFRETATFAFNAFVLSCFLPFAAPGSAGLDDESVKRTRWRAS